MASYRNISMDFWTDSKVVDDFTPEDRYIYLYCMTNPHTNLCGCYEVSIKQIANETGYNNDTVERLLKRLDSAHNVIRYSAQTKELLILEEEMKAVAGNLYVTTDDGSYGRSGMVTKTIQDLVEQEGKHYDLCVAIGPMIMMKFVCKTTEALNIPTIVSLNPIMVDGTGMCGACRVTVGGEVKFACVDGPEFDGHLVNFDEAMQRQQIYKTQEGRAYLAAKEKDTHHGGCGQCGGEE